MDFAETIYKSKPDKVEAIGEGKFGAQLATYSNGYRAVLKTVSAGGKKAEVRTFRGIPLDTVPMREVAFYKLAKKLGWQDIVPETVLHEYKGEVASYQLFVPSIYLRELDKSIFDDKNKNRVHNLRVLSRRFPKDEWRRLVLLDLIGNNRDRHGKNVIVRFPGPHLVAIDNSIAFGTCFGRYRDIFHKYLFPRSFNFEPYRDTIKNLTKSDLSSLHALLKPTEVAHIFMRAQFLLRFPYLTPFETMSEGQTGLNDFPSRKPFFREKARIFQERPLVLSPERPLLETAQAA